MAKRRISKASKRRLTFFGTLSLVAIFYFGFSLLYNLYTIHSLINEKKELNILYVELQEKASTLKKDIEKLNNEKYLAAYARKEYGYTGKDEYILKIQDVEEEQENINSEINKNYIMFGLGVLIIFIFIYIFIKGRKSNK